MKEREREQGRNGREIVLKKDKKIKNKEREKN